MGEVYRAGQEDQLGAFGSVLNAVALFNTRNIDPAVNVLCGQGYPVRDADAAPAVAAGVRAHQHARLACLPRPIGGPGVAPTCAILGSC